MVQKMEFLNPEKLPLGELVFSVQQDGVQMKIPALSQHWVDQRVFTKYHSIPLIENNIEETAALDEWINDAKYFNKDMEYLLKLPHFKFWSNLVFEKQCMEAITSFLQEATPCYLNLPSLTDNENVLNVYQNIMSNVLRIICRIITNKESEEEWITKLHLQELLYSNFLISIPLIFDLIVAYGRTNLTVLLKIVVTIFKIQPKYIDDLKVGLKFLQNVFKIIQRKTENEELSDAHVTGISSFDDLALYTLDCAISLGILLEILPEAKVICCDLQMEQSISNFYDNTIPTLYKNIFLINSESNCLEILNSARIELLKSFRLIIYVNIENILKNPDESTNPAESYIGIMTECLADRLFVIDYQQYFPIESDIDILKQACPELDHFKADFILKAYTSEGECHLLEMIENDVAQIELNDKTNKAQTDNNYIDEEKIPVAPPIKTRNLEKELTEVKDILPHLGDGFIRRLLSRYENSEQVIAAVLESNLPPDLAKADQSEVYIPPDPRDTMYFQTGVQRYNVYDGDQYDIMTQDNPNCIIKGGKGFPGQPKNMKQLLDDKSHVHALKERYQEYSLVTDDNEYDDEYDDSYEALAESESKTSKIKFGRDRFVDEVEEEDDSESDSDDNADQNENGNNKRDPSKDFCENPEITRARYEAKRAAKYANRGGGANKFNQKTSKDVVGNPKGQGQDQKVVNERHKKDVNKSSRANHNRKSGASWKRSRGMFPS